MAYTILCEEAGDCFICERMQERKAVLGPLNGNIYPKVLFLAEAPGRNGADRTRRPFYGDASGKNFDVLLESVNLSREDIFITNSILCSPRKPSGANDKPTKTELRNCSGFLRRQIELIDTPIIATLGATALDALRMIENHEFKLKDHAGQILQWNGRRLVPLYHPSPQVIISVRPLAKQIEDFKALKSIL